MPERKVPRPVVPLDLLTLVGRIHVPHLQHPERRDAALQLCQRVIDHEADRPGSLSRSPDLRRHFNQGLRILQAPLRAASVRRLKGWAERLTTRQSFDLAGLHQAEIDLWWMLAACRDCSTIAHWRLDRTTPSRTVSRTIRRHLREEVYPRIKWGARAAQAHLLGRWNEVIAALGSAEERVFVHRGLTRRYVRVMPVVLSTASADVQRPLAQRAAYAAHMTEAVARRLELFRQLHDPYHWVLRHGRVGDGNAYDSRAEQLSLLDLEHWAAFNDQVGRVAKGLASADPWSSPGGAAPWRVLVPYPVIAPGHLADDAVADALGTALSEIYRDDAD